jgi:hypothetical protein
MYCSYRAMHENNIVTNLVNFVMSKPLLGWGILPKELRRLESHV